MRLAMGFANCLARSCDSCAAAAVEPMAAIASARIGAAILQDVSLVTTSRVAMSLPLQSLEPRSEEHTSELQSLMRNSYAVFCLKKKTTPHIGRDHNVTKD